jgi:hypothetical protein
MFKMQSDLVGALTLLVLLIWLGLRITQGADLSDESYYAVYLDDWLKEGIRASPFLTLHQTSALLVYPAALLFHGIAGSTDGLILFLRVLYITGALIAALSAVALFRRAGMRLAAWLAGALVLAFIPFGLPAPSYNSLGEHATIAALAGSACALLERDARPRIPIFWIIFSAAAWAVATVAYPSLLLSLASLLVYLVFVIRPIQPTLYLHAGMILLFQIFAWTSVVSLLTLSRIRDSINYQASIAGSFQIETKMHLIADTFLQNLWFSLAVVFAILIGCLRAHLTAPTTSLAISALFIALLFFPSTLFLHSHDAIFLAALTGLGLPFAFRQSCDRATHVLVSIYSVALIAGAATAATATHGLFAFPIGGFLAAIIAVLLNTSERAGAWGLVPGAALLGLLVWCSTSFYYGEFPSVGRQKRERITQGVYAGLASSEETAHLIRIATAALGRWPATDETIAVVGRLPGLYLLTSARPRTLLPFHLRSEFVQPGGLSATYDYYANSANRPTIVVVYEDPYFQPVNPFGPRFAEWYRLISRERTPLGELSIFRRRNAED